MLEPVARRRRFGLVRGLLVFAVVAGAGLGWALEAAPSPLAENEKQKGEGEDESQSEGKKEADQQGKDEKKPASPEDPEATARHDALKAAELELKGAIVALNYLNVREAAEQVAAFGGEEAMGLLLEWAAKIPASEDAIYWGIIRGIVSFADRPAMKKLGDFLLKKKDSPLVRDIVYGLTRNRSAHVVAALRKLILEGPQDLRPLAASSIASRRVPQAVDTLIELLQVEERSKPAEPTSLMWIAADGLTSLTGENFGPSSVNWSGWWAKNRKKPLRGSGPLEEAGGKATGTAVDFIDRLRRQEFIGVEQAPPRKVVVLSADYKRKTKRDLNNDHMEKVLENMNIPHTVVSREDFAQFDLKETGAILINCAQFHQFCICPTCKPDYARDTLNRLYRCSGCNKHEDFSAELSAADIKKLQEFVNRGGYLFCEDWTVKEVVEKAFPRYVVAGVKLVRKAPGAEPNPNQRVETFRILAENTVDVVPARGASTHPYLRGIYTPAADDPGAVDIPGAEADLAGGVKLDIDGEEGEGDGAKSKEGALEEESEGKTVVEGGPGVEVGEEEQAAEPVEVTHEWTIDDKSYALKIVDRRGVVPLLSSGRLQKVAEGEGAVAVAFRPGKSSVLPGQKASGRLPGVVVVVLSHFGKQQSTADEHSIQHLLLNVLMDANSVQTAAAGKKKERSKEEPREVGEEKGKEKENENENEKKEPGKPPPAGKPTAKEKAKEE